MAELALVAPLFFAILFAIIDFGRVIWANDVVASAAREGARYASVHAGATEWTPTATKTEIREHTLGYVIAGGVNTTVDVCFSAVTIGSGEPGCSGDADTAEYVRGGLVTVRVQSRVPLTAGAFIGLGEFTVAGESTVIVNN